VALSETGESVEKIYKGERAAGRNFKAGELLRPGRVAKLIGLGNGKGGKEKRMSLPTRKIQASCSKRIGGL